LGPSNTSKRNTTGKNCPPQGSATSLPSNRPLGLLSFLGNIGVLVLIFSITGSVLAVIKHRRKDLILIVWILAMLLLSNAYWVGINVISYRVLISLLIPLSIVGGYAISYAYQWMKTSDKFSSKKLRIGFLVVILGLPLLVG
jgi:apolipoprotein N-acyltransferase